MIYFVKTSSSEMSIVHSVCKWKWNVISIHIVNLVKIINLPIEERFPFDCIQLINFDH